jgi:hypothetical protein
VMNLAALQQVVHAQVSKDQLPLLHAIAAHVQPANKCMLWQHYSDVVLTIVSHTMWL